MGEVLLKYKFLTQSVPNIVKQLQKSVAKGEKSLDQLVQLATSVYYNWNLTKKRTPGPYLCTQGAPHPMGPHSQDMLPMWTGRTLP
jgi:hypothetical protein